MSHFGPFLLFDGDCVEAMLFYQSCFGGELTVTKLSDTPMSVQYPPADQDRVVNARLKSGVIDITATDWLHPTRKPQPGNMVCVYISDAPYSELKRYFDKLSVGADPDLLDNLTDMPFGSYGHLADRYGVHWFFQGDKAPAPVS